MSRNKGQFGMLTLVVIAAAVLFVLWIATMIFDIELFGASAKEVASIESEIDLFVKANEEGTLINALLRSDVEGYKIIDAFSVLDSTADDSLKIPIENGIERILNGVSKSLGKNYYINVRNSQGLPVYQRSSSDPKNSGTAYEFDKLELVWPADSRYVTGGFGYREIHPVTGEPNVFHAGTDVRGGTPENGLNLYSVYYGKVVATPNKGVPVDQVPATGYGKSIIVEQEFNGRKYWFFYGHLAEIDVSEGDQVRPGQVIGKIGNTGLSEAPHLHIEIRADLDDDGLYDKDEEVLPLCIFFDEDEIDNPEDCFKSCPFYDKKKCEAGLAWEMGVAIDRSYVDIPMVNGEKGSMELVLWG